MSILNSEFVKEKVTGIEYGMTYVRFTGISLDNGLPMHCHFKFSDKELLDSDLIQKLKTKIENSFRIDPA